MFQLIRNNSFIILFCWCAMATALNKRMPRVIFNVKRSAYRGGGMNYRYCKLCSNVAQQDKKKSPLQNTSSTRDISKNVSFIQRLQIRDPTPLIPRRQGNVQFVKFLMTLTFGMNLENRFFRSLCNVPYLKIIYFCKAEQKMLSTLYVI